MWIKHSGFIICPLIKFLGFSFNIDDINCYDVNKNCPLYYAAKNGDLDFCTFLITNGADVNMPCENGNTALF